MTEKKKIIVWALVVVLLIATILFLVLGGKEDAGTKADSKVPGAKTELQQGEGTTVGEEVPELTPEPTAEPTPEPTREPEPTQGVIELPFIPIE